ncbi:hypothetical protein CLV84_0924 [Neolewinella xylanilytica]|uniref:Uncharacterized protein n=2 Tax=Neolewinella xylanilytica TaxID=1514080 RepID=A0A2S6I8Y6_9BACT|nr:hypothetical protein CLV84_0924 [Neolewinella xylanilytica]
MVLTAKLLKHEGLSQSSHSDWLLQIITLVQRRANMTVQARAFIEGMIVYFTDHVVAYGEDTASAELFGYRRKYLPSAATNIKDDVKAISADILSIALYN